jgi:hypothetical protein
MLVGLLRLGLSRARLNSTRAIQTTHAERLSLKEEASGVFCGQTTHFEGTN